MLELKYEGIESFCKSVFPFNRTMLELKFGCSLTDAHDIHLLIAPCWN